MVMPKRRFSRRGDGTHTLTIHPMLGSLLSFSNSAFRFSCVIAFESSKSIAHIRACSDVAQKAAPYVMAPSTAPRPASSIPMTHGSCVQISGIPFRSIRVAIGSGARDPPSKRIRSGRRPALTGFLPPEVVRTVG